MSQPSASDIDEFRIRILQQIIEGEKRREAERQRRERACYHRFEPQLSSEPIPIGYMLWICTKCDRQIWRQLPKNLK